MNRTRATTAHWIGFAVVVALLAVAPLVLPEFWRRFVTEILIWGLLAMSSDILIGYTGMISFGHSAFFGLGMYGAAATSPRPRASQRFGGRMARRAAAAPYMPRPKKAEWPKEIMPV